MPENSTLVDGVTCFHWSPAAGRGENFGDVLGPLIVRAMLARAMPAGAASADGSRRLLSVGSVLQFSRDGDVVWGSGINGKVRPDSYAPTLDVRAVRGPVTRAGLMAYGIHAPEVYGDPALLLPRLFPELATIERMPGHVVVPNLNELDRFEGPRVVDPLGEVMTVIRRIAAAEFVTGTSLHAMIIADALGIPSRPIRSVAEHPLKYIDHYLGTGRPDVVFADSVEHALELGPVPPPVFDEDALAAAFPGDLWGLSAAPAPETVEAQTGPGPRLSIVISTRDDAPWLPDMLPAVLADAGPDAEIIVVDAGSSDDSSALVASIVEGDGRVVRATAPGRGRGPARNTGADLARGRFVLFCDGSDLVPQGALAALSDSLTHSGSDIALGDALSTTSRTTRRAGESVSAFARPGTARALRDEPELVGARVVGAAAFSRAFLARSGIRFPDVPEGAELAPLAAALVVARSIDVIGDVTVVERVRFPAWCADPRDADDAALVGLLTQQLAAAQFAAAANDPAVDAASASVVFAHETARAVAQHVLSWEGPRARDGEIAGTLALLLRSVGPPPADLPFLARLALELASCGEMAAARAAVELRTLSWRAPLSERLRLWTSVLEGMAQSGIPAGADLAYLSDAIVPHLLVPWPEGEDLTEVWMRAYRSVRDALGDDRVRHIPEIATTADKQPRLPAFRARAEVRGALASVRGGSSVRLEGTALVGGQSVTPVLFVADGARVRVIRPSTVRWSDEGEGFRWSAVFSARSVPVHVPVGLGLLPAETGTVVPVSARIPLPAYDRRDSFVYEGVSGSFLLRNRRHWMTRAAGRAARGVRDRIRRGR